MLHTYIFCFSQKSKWNDQRADGTFLGVREEEPMKGSKEWRRQQADAARAAKAEAH